MGATGSGFFLARDAVVEGLLDSAAAVEPLGRRRRLLAWGLRLFVLARFSRSESESLSSVIGEVTRLAAAERVTGAK